jgi:hypothetical protein
VYNCVGATETNTSLSSWTLLSCIIVFTALKRAILTSISLDGDTDGDVETTTIGAIDGEEVGVIGLNVGSSVQLLVHCVGDGEGAFVPPGDRGIVFDMRRSSSMSVRKAFTTTAFSSSFDAPAQG